MKVCTIDVGLKNLALCVASCQDRDSISNYTIHYWNVINTLEEEQTCTAIVKSSGRVCGKKASFQSANDKFACKPHAKTDPSTGDCWTSYKAKGTKDMTLQEMTRAMLSTLQNILDQEKELFHTIDRIEIELQPRVNNKMKLISHVIFGKFVEFYHNTNTNTLVRFTRASQKLKAYTGPALVCSLKGAYAKRKWLGVQYAKWFLETTFAETQKLVWLPWFESCTKKDDLSDVLLMAINALHGLPQRQQLNGSTSIRSSRLNKCKNQPKTHKARKP
jgi:hypothetical protein